MTLIDYTNLNTSPPTRRINYEVFKLLVTIFCSHSTFDGGWLKCNFTSIDKDEFEDVFQAMPELRVDMVCNTLPGQSAFLYYLANLGPRLTQPQHDYLNNYINTWDNEGLLKGYFEDQTLAPVVMLSSWADVAHQDTVFVLSKTQLSLNILKSFSKLQQASSRMSKSYSDLLLGNITKSDSLALANEINNLRSILFGFITEYFSLSPRTGDLEKFLVGLFGNYNKLDSITISQLKTFHSASTLHLNHQHIPLDDVYSWDEPGALSGKIDEYITKINKSSVDPVIVAQSKLRMRKENSVSIIARILEMVSITENSPEIEFKLENLINDLSHLNKQLIEINDMGVRWEEESFGISQSQITSFMEQLQKRKLECSEQVKGDKNMKSQLENIYLKQIKPFNIKKLKSKQDWLEILPQWEFQKLKYPNKTLALAALKDILGDAIDIAHLKFEVDLDKAESYLISRWGNSTDVIQQSISELLNLKPPNNRPSRENNLAKILSIVSLCKTPYEWQLLTVSVIKSIMNTALIAADSLKFFEQYRKIKLETLEERKNLDPNITVNTFELHWEKQCSEIRKNIIIEFCESQLDLIRLTSSKTQNTHAPFNPRNRVVDPKESWRCPLCKQSHSKGSKVTRPFLSVCIIFLQEFSIERRIQACKNYNYCLICYSYKADTHSGSSCPQQARFGCRKHNVQSTSHGSLTCRKPEKDSGTKDQTSRGGGRGGRGDRGNGRGRGGRGGRSNRGGRGGSATGGHGHQAGVQANNLPYNGVYPVQRYSHLPNTSVDYSGSIYPLYASNWFSKNPSTASVPLCSGGKRALSWDSPPCPLSCPDGQCSDPHSVHHHNSPTQLAINHSQPVLKQTQDEKNNNEWMKVRHLFQPILEASIVSKTGTHSILALSDSGSSVGFLDINCARNLQIEQSGSWCGSISTMLGVKEVTTPFFKVQLKLSQTQHYYMFCLGTSPIDGRRQLPPHIVKFATELFKITPQQLSTIGGTCSLLIGQDSNFLLLKPVTKVNGKQITKPKFAQDLSLEISPASQKYSLVGSIGGSSKDQCMTADVQNFTSLLMKGGIFEFADSPDPDDAKSLIRQFPGAVVTVRSNYADTVINRIKKKFHPKFFSKTKLVQNNVYPLNM